MPWTLQHLSRHLPSAPGDGSLDGRFVHTELLKLAVKLMQDHSSILHSNRKASDDFAMMGAQTARIFLGLLVAGTGPQELIKPRNCGIAFASLCPKEAASGTHHQGAHPQAAAGKDQGLC